jgi:hypothetical protein
MKKFAFVLAILMLAAPALARVEITCTSTTDGVVTVSYDASGEPNLVRAFAMNIVPDSGAKITAVGDFNSKYPIYPGSIDINVAENKVDDDGNAVCDPCEYDDTLPGLNTTGGITVEMASLYQAGDDANKPASSGTLFKLVVDSDCCLTFTENATRGGIVLEDPEADPDPNFVGANICVSTGCDCWGDVYTAPDGDGWITAEDATQIFTKLREARDTTSSPIYTGGFYFPLTTDGYYDCYDTYPVGSGDGWITAEDAPQVFTNLRDARDETSSPYYTGGFYYPCP